MQQTPPSSPEKKTAELPKSAYIKAVIVTLVLCIGMFVLAAISNHANFTTYQASRPPAPPTSTPTDPNPNAPVTCNGQTMYQNEGCDHIFTINGSTITTTYTYEEQREYQAKNRIDEIIKKRQEQQLAHDAPVSITTFFGYLTSLLCLGGLLFGFCCFVAILTFVGQRKKRTENLSAAGQKSNPS